MERDNKINLGNSLLINGHQYDQFRIIQNIDMQAGFTALILYVLNGIRKAEELNQYPVIDLSETSNPNFYDKDLGENIWDYYFEPINSYNYQELISSNVSNQLIYVPKDEEVMHAHHNEENRLATFWAWAEPKDKVAWMKEKRVLGRSYVKKYIQVKASILTKVEDFIARSFRAKHIIGVHIRGTDFAYATATSIKDYFNELDQLMKGKAKEEIKIFLATDQEQYVTDFIEKYGDQVITYNAIRSNSEIAPFRFTGVSNYKKGEDVLIDTIILSKCNFLIKGSAAVGEMALWFNPTLECKDFALNSTFVSKKYHQLHSTYVKQNIGKHNYWKLKYLKTLETATKFFESKYILRPIYKAYLYIRKRMK